MAQFWDDFGVRVVTTVLITPIAVALWKLTEHLWHRWYSRKLRLAADRYAAANQHQVEVALVLSVGESVIEAARQHLKSLGKLGGNADIPIEEVFQREGFGDRDGQWFAYLEEVKKRIVKVRELGAICVFVYTKLPVAMAVMVGATLMNGPEAVVHHFNNGSYTEVGRIRFETMRT
jgi:hypothetical protein